MIRQPVDLAFDSAEPRYRAFEDMADVFLRLTLDRLGVVALSDLPPLRTPPTGVWVTKDLPLDPAAGRLVAGELSEHLSAPDSIVAFRVIPIGTEGEAHPLIRAGKLLGLSDRALGHPLEGHSLVVERHGRADGTVKVHDVDRIRGHTGGYREQGETSDAFLLHHDGLGSAGAVDVVGLHCDSVPASGGMLYFQDVGRAALEVARDDHAAFRAMFRPDAVSVTRPRGRGAITVRGPLLYVDRWGQTRSNLRIPCGEYKVDLLAVAEVRRAWSLLQPFCLPSSPGVRTLQFEPLVACFFRNAIVAHGRTAFVDHPPDRVRCLSRKWYMVTEEFAVYRHVPGLAVHPAFADLFPELFGDGLLDGEWNLAADGSANVRRT